MGNVPDQRVSNTYPIGSMYAIYGNIYHQYTPNVSIYIFIPYMDPMGTNGYDPFPMVIGK